MAVKSMVPFGMIVWFLFILACVPPEKAPVLSGPYLGQEPPGEVPIIFAPGIISHGFHELGLAVAPNHDEIFYIMSDNEYSHYVIVSIRQDNGIWTSPRIAPFTGPASNYALCFSGDGKRLYFSSKRPHPGSVEPRKDFDVWFTERKEEGWGPPQILRGFAREGLSEVNISFATSGRMYLQISQPGSGGDIYYSDFSDGRYQEPVPLSNPVNTVHNESRPFIAPDESYLLFHSNRPGTLGVMDIYVSFRQEKGTWSEPANLGEPTNTQWSDFDPYVSPDGKYLFFSSYRGCSPDIYKGKSYKELLELYRSPQNGYATLYWMDAKIIEKLRPSSSR